MKFGFFVHYDRPKNSWWIPRTVKCNYIKIGASTVLKTSHRLIETSKGVYDWSDMDWIVPEASRYGRKPVFMIGGTPEWCAKNPASEGIWGPGSNSPYTDQQHISDFVKAVHNRYRIKFYLGWNELNTSQYWSGSIDEAVEIQKTLFESLPDCHIVSANCTGIQNDIFGRFYEKAHTYCHSAGYMIGGHPEYVDARISWVQKKITKPLWSIECGINEDGYLNGLTHEEQRLRVWTVLRSHEKHSVDTILWYGWNGEREGIKFSPALNIWKAYTWV